MATDNRVMPTGLIRVTTSAGEAYIDPAYITMVSRASPEGAAICVSGVAANPVLVTEAPAVVLALLKEGRAVQAVGRRVSLEAA